MHVLHMDGVWNYLSPVHFGHYNLSDQHHQIILKSWLGDQNLCDDTSIIR